MELMSQDMTREFFYSYWSNIELPAIDLSFSLVMYPYGPRASLNNRQDRDQAR